jgi:DnaK suppressor protein
VHPRDDLIARSTSAHAAERGDWCVLRHAGTPRFDYEALSSGSMPLMDDPHAVLTNKLAEIDAQLTAMERPPTDQGSISFGKRVGEGTSIAVDRLTQVAAHDQLQRTRADIVRALQKLDEETYGQCDVCGEPIPEGRLEARPWAVLCVADAAKQ